MKWSKSKSIILAGAIVTIATIAYAADNVIYNPVPDQDTVIKVNDGGLVKEVFRANASDNKVVVGDLEVTGTTTGVTTVATATVEGIVTSYAPIVESNTHTVTGANYTVLDDDKFEYIFVDTVGAGRTIFLPTAADNDGRDLTVYKINDTYAQLVTLDGEGSETISGALTRSFDGQYGYMKLHCNGVAWFVLDLYDRHDFQLDNQFTSGGMMRIARVPGLVTISSIGAGAAHASLSSASSSAIVPARFRPVVDMLVIYEIDPAVVRKITVLASGVINTSYRNWSGTATVQGGTGNQMTISYYLPL